MNDTTRLGDVAQTLMDATAEAMIMVDDRGHIEHLSHSAGHLFGVEAGSCVGAHLASLLAPGYDQQIRERLAELRASGQSPEVSGYRVVARDRQGKEFPMALEIGEAQLPEYRRFVCVCRDLTPQDEHGVERESAINLNRALFDAAVDGIITIDSHGRIRSFNRAAETLFGFTRAEVLDQNVAMLMPEHYAKNHDSYIDNYLRTGEARIIGIGRDVVGQRKDGSRFPLHLSVGEAWHHAEKHFIGICHDLSDYHEALRKLALAEKRYKDIVHSQTQMICRVDSDLKITFVNRSFMDCVGKSLRELVGTPLHQFAMENQAAIRDLLTQLFTAGGVHQLTVKMTMAARARNPDVEWTFTRPGNGNGENIELQGFGVDISEREKARREADYFRNYDTVTGLYNKQAFMSSLPAWAAAESSCSLIHIDLDSFGLVNQKHGFKAGDHMLREVARRLRTIAGKNCLIARSGADDFLIAAPASSLPEVKNLTDRLASGIRKNLSVDGETLSIDTAIGVAFYPSDSDDVQRLPNLAESAMKDARTQRESIALFNKESHSQLRRRLDIEQALKRAMEDDGLHILLQPKYAIPSRRISGFEALIRWNDPELGPVSPGEFVPLVEHTKLGQRFDRYVIGKAVAAIQQVAASGVGQLPVAINITPPHFSNPDLAGFILDQLKQSGISPQLLEVELTEGVFLKPNANVANNLATLRGAGVRVAIDDFGTGYSSLSYIKNLQVDELKVDKSFTDELHTHTGKTVLQAVVLIAKAFDLLVTAEGVETAQQLTVLEDMDCDRVQGFYLSRPVSVDDACKLIRHSPEA